MKRKRKELPIGPIKKGCEERMLASLGETVKRLRKCAHISQMDTADILALHQTAVCRVELGLQSLQPWQLQKICELYDLGLPQRRRPLCDGNSRRVSPVLGLHRYTYAA